MISFPVAVRIQMNNRRNFLKTAAAARPYV
jgi:hypothetical protein